MPKHTARVLIASDGSPAAEAALTTAARFPWPDTVRVRVLAAHASLPTESHAAQRSARDGSDDLAAKLRRTARKIWDDSEVVIADAPPVDAILAEASRQRASIVVVGWRGHGRLRRALTGSVSRTVASRAKCSVLVVREAPRAVRRFVLGYDGSANARRALDLMCSLEPQRTSRVVLVNVVESVSVPGSLSRLPAFTRQPIRRGAAALGDERHRRAILALDAAVARLEERGWRAERELRNGAPLDNLLRAVAEHRADVLVVGARGVSGIERALLGSVSNRALDRSPVPVLIVR
jgi:nucleotide-binding universal stress UspA family protein